MSRKILWVDLECTGLGEPYSTIPDERILEVGLRITDWQGNRLDQVSLLVWNDDWQEVLSRNPIALQMHIDSGLVADLNTLANNPWRTHESSPEQVCKKLVRWCHQRLTVEDLSSGLPMTGNSVHYDRKFLNYWMNDLHGVWGYRNNDISSTREQCRLINPALFAKIPQQPKAHRPQADIDASVSLWQWLIDNFLWPEPVQES